MTTYDISPLPPPVHDALLCLVEALVKAWTAPAAEGNDHPMVDTADAVLPAVLPEAAPPRFPRRAVELRVLRVSSGAQAPAGLHNNGGE